MLLEASRWIPFFPGLPSQSEQTTLNRLDWNFVMPRMPCEVVANGECRVGWLYTSFLFLDAQQVEERLQSVPHHCND